MAYTLNKLTPPIQLPRSTGRRMDQSKEDLYTLTSLSCCACLSASSLDVLMSCIRCLMWASATLRPPDSSASCPVSSDCWRFNLFHSAYIRRDKKDGFKTGLEKRLKFGALWQCSMQNKGYHVMRVPPIKWQGFVCAVYNTGFEALSNQYKHKIRGLTCKSTQIKFEFYF